ncbi:MAG: hypothetical protein H6807_12150 [Planctomycetes bacterium]|nr:hypothetical protein [Planctomycetota bacterium]
MSKWLILVVLALPVLCPAQIGSGDVDIGYCDLRDSLSGTTGLTTLVRERRELAGHAFRLDDPAGFQPEAWDLVVIGSYSELDPSWDAFVRREKSRLLRWVEQGGTLVRMARYRKSDRDEGRKLDLLPPSYEVFRGSDDEDEWHASPDLLDLWRNLDDELKVKGDPAARNPADRLSWYRMPAGRYGEIKHGAVDAFERWSSQFTRSAGKEIRGDFAYALHADYGRGRIILLQFAFDKVDGARDPLSGKVSRRFTAVLAGYARSHPNPAKRRPEPIRPDPVRPEPDRPDRGNQPPPPEPLPINIRVEGRVFVDRNGNGRRDLDEVGLALTLRGPTGRIVADASGRFSFSRRRQEACRLEIELPPGFELPGGFFRDLAPEASRKAVESIELALRPLPETAGTAIVAASLPAGLDDPSIAASVEARLIQVARKEDAHRLILLAGEASEAELEAFAERLKRLISAAPGFQLYPVFAPGSVLGATLAPADWSFVSGSWCCRAGTARAEPMPADPGLQRLDVANGAPDPDPTPGSRRLGSAPSTRPDESQLVAPELLDPRDLGAPARYLVLESGPRGPGIRLEPAPPEPVDPGPKLPVHVWGRGDLGRLLEEARRAAKD